MTNVYYAKVSNKTTINKIQEITQNLLKTLIKNERLKLEKEIPLKVHFGEDKNTTYIKPETYNGIINFLKEKNIKSKFMETLVVYGGKRNLKNSHIELALNHGFTQLPIVIADGEHGENFDNITINKKHYTTCKIGGDFSKYKQILILAHFKGHSLAGFGGAIKQLSMGMAAKGGKLEMHMGIKPKVISRKCIKCGLCLKACNEGAMKLNKKSVEINYDKCVGCGGCVAVCPHKAITVFTIKGIYNMLFQKNSFQEKLAEYAYAAQKNKHNIYFNFAMNITKGCDCVGKPMKPITDDIGVFISTDPVAIDSACYDLVKKQGKTFNGYNQLKYAQKIGLGKIKYNLIEI